MRFRPEQHLRRQSDFRRIREEGRRIDCGAFTLWWRPAGEPALNTPPLRRLGVVASTAAVGHAVLRNRAKRRLREMFRRHQLEVPAAGDLLLVARGAVNRQPLPAVEERFVQAVRRLAPATHA